MPFDGLIKPRSTASLNLSVNYTSHESHILYPENHHLQVIINWRNEQCLAGNEDIFFSLFFLFLKLWTNLAPSSLKLTIALKLYFAGLRKAIDHEVLKNEYKKGMLY